MKDKQFITWLHRHSYFEISTALKNFGCERCDLGCQKDNTGKRIIPVLHRGNLNSKRMIIAEGPGHVENEKGLPLVGPAGQLLDKIFASVGWDTNKDFSLHNVTKCINLPASGSNKKSLNPERKHIETCRPYIEHEINCLNPELVVLVGKTAVQSILGDYLGSGPMYELAGRVHRSSQWPQKTFFVLYHPASIIHSKNDSKRYQELREAMWEHIQKLKQLTKENL